jgi:hypothetical protein
MLKEELKNSISMKAGYEKALKNLPSGSLRAKKRGEKYYYYLAKRENGKHKDIYLGLIPDKEVKKYMQAKEMRAKYRKLLSQAKKQIKFLKGAIRGKEAI